MTLNNCESLKFFTIRKRAFGFFEPNPSPPKKTGLLGVVFDFCFKYTNLMSFCIALAIVDIMLCFELMLNLVFSVSRIFNFICKF